jgi:ribose 5-phosphate isomerase B
MRIAITADHNGTALKARLAGHLRAAGHEVDDRGRPPTAEGRRRFPATAGGRSGSPGADGEVTDYPALCLDLGLRVVRGQADRGIVIGGSGSGEHMACNKIRGVRAGLALERFTTEISRAHNDANVLVIGAKVVPPELAEELTDLWLATPFKGGRHQLRLDQVAAIERGDPLPGVP